MIGRPPIPTALKLLNGDKHKDRMNPNEPKPPAVTPDMPTTLDKYGRKIWQRTVPILERNGLLTEVDGDTLAEYCHLQALNAHVSRALKRCRYKMLAEKHTVDGAGNEILEVKTNPLVTQKMQISAKLLPYLREFGMSPASRTRIQVAGGGRKDEFFD